MYCGFRRGYLWLRGIFADSHFSDSRTGVLLFLGLGHLGAGNVFRRIRLLRLYAEKGAASNNDFSFIVCCVWLIVIR